METITTFFKVIAGLAILLVAVALVSVGNNWPVSDVVVGGMWISLAIGGIALIPNDTLKVLFALLGASGFILNVLGVL